ncbi:zinc-binding alcohol dehydrogenase family protein [Desmospora activa]|uniref:L-gulonate 5-dehydrogenase n=1 Tax=Desmospora activa DSM 45169 TaxID=1121389 RepID=A0A2T4Z3X6_9BACL|nr:zinc-binding alcohol dehydrogenase family protein [Desmospora activa]PTM56592.1 L-gulonate 5-dehydrogenase [Desmospora activa DSM 45169]
MKAVQISQPGSIAIMEREMPRLQHGRHVRIKVRAVGICGSDMHIYHGSNPLATYPRVIGHEVAGEIEAVGEEVTRFAAGDPVVLEPIHTCGDCYACKNGRANVCEKLEVYGVHRDGGLQEYIVVEENRVHRVNSQLDWVEAVLVEPFTIGAQANWRGDVRAGDVVFIMGAGPTGLSCLAVAKMKGATCIVSDLSAERLAFAQHWGADHTIQATDSDIKAEIRQITANLGANVVIDAVGTPHTFADAIDVVSVAGRVVCLGFHSQPSSISQLSITKKEVTVAGSRLQSNQFPQVIDWFNQGKIKAKEMVTHVFPFDQVQEAMALIEEHPEQVRKVVLRVNE